MKTISKKDLVGKYWDNRWEYISYVISILPEVEKVLEIGSNGVPIVKDCDTMDIVQFDGLTYLADAREPFHFKNKEYDLLIALQTWEHLYDDEKHSIGSRQKEAFKEVQRVSKEAIISFPYKWTVRMRKDDCHYNIDEEKIAEWTGNLPYKSKKIIESLGGRRNRIIYHWVF